MWNKIKVWLLDNEKLLLPVIGVAIALIWLAPEYLYQIALTLYLLFKGWEIASDKSTNSLVKNITPSNSNVSSSPTKTV